MKNILMHIGRILLALYFLAPGIAKFISWDYHVALMESHNMVMVPTLLAIAGVAQIIGSISLLVNKKVIFCALGFAVMTILININLHDFWNAYEGVDAKHETQNFVKNLGIFAGLLLLAAVNLDERKKG
ncbi:MAG: DoxX family protein [Hellea sp.]|nr:DoxX family protein [Hellea sp.]